MSDENRYYVTSPDSYRDNSAHRLLRRPAFCGIHFVTR